MGHKNYIEGTEDPGELLKCQFRYPDGDLCGALGSHEIHHLDRFPDFHQFTPLPVKSISTDVTTKG